MAETRDAVAAATELAGARPGRDAARRRTQIRAQDGWQSLNLGELWRSRELLWIFAARDVKVRYKQTFFGFAWALVVPAAQVAVFTLLFGGALGVSDRVNRAAGRDLPYPLFALAGQIVWNFFRATVDGSSMSLMANAQLIRKVYVPRLMLPFAALGRPIVDAAVVLVLLLGLMIAYASSPGSSVALSPTLLLSPLLILCSALPALGLGLTVAALTVSYRDLQQVLPVFTSLLFFVTPVIYSVDVLPARFAWLVSLNPVAGFVEAHRAVVLQVPVDWDRLMLSAALSLVLLVVGVFLFARAERRFADVG